MPASLHSSIPGWLCWKCICALSCPAAPKSRHIHYWQRTSSFEAQHEYYTASWPLHCCLHHGFSKWKLLGILEGLEGERRRAELCVCTPHCAFQVLPEWEPAFWFQVWGNATAVIAVTNPSLQQRDYHSNGNLCFLDNGKQISFISSKRTLWEHWLWQEPWAAPDQAGEVFWCFAVSGTAWRTAFFPAVSPSRKLSSGQSW